MTIGSILLQCGHLHQAKSRKTTFPRAEERVKVSSERPWGVSFLREKSGASAPEFALVRVVGLMGRGGWASRKIISPTKRAAGINAAM